MNYDDFDVNKLSLDEKLSRIAADKLRREGDMMERFNDDMTMQTLKNYNYYPGHPEYDEMYSKVRQAIDADMPYEYIQRIVSPATRIMAEEVPITTRLLEMANGSTVPFKRGKGNRGNEARYKL